MGQGHVREGLAPELRQIIDRLFRAAGGADAGIDAAIQRRRELLDEARAGGVAGVVLPLPEVVGEGVGYGAG